MRLFVAFEVPADARAAALAAVAPIREGSPQARWVPEENLHVTLKFLGEVDPRLDAWVPERIAEAAVRVRPFEVALAGIGAFRSAKRARVVWAGLRDLPPGAMADAAAAVDAALATEFSAETRPFAAHLTLARSDPPLTLTVEDLDVELETPAWTVEYAVLFRSHLRRPAPRYEPLRRFPFGVHD
jgi:RNA 2',3'-cyclic 3'-phosphodiesterase